MAMVPDHYRQNDLFQTATNSVIYSAAVYNAIAGRMGLTCATINRILPINAAMGTLVPGKCAWAPRKTTARQGHAV